MPNAEKIVQTIKELIPEDTVAQFHFPDSSESYINHRIAVISQMDKLLTKEQRLAVMEKQGCCTTGKPAAVHRAFGKKYADKTLEEKLRLYETELDTPHKPPCRLNGDGTLSVFWGFEKDGNYQCVCGNMKKLPQPIQLSPTYCGCCGGHVRQNLQKSLGVQLKLKEIMSSPLFSNGEKQCEFLFEIVG